MKKSCSDCEKFEFRYFLELFVGIKIFPKNPFAEFLFGKEYDFEKTSESFEEISYIFFHPQNEDAINYLFGITEEKLEEEFLYLEKKFQNFKIAVNVEYKNKYVFWCLQKIKEKNNIFLFFYLS